MFMQVIIESNHRMAHQLSSIFLRQVNLYLRVWFSLKSTVNSVFPSSSNGSSFATVPLHPARKLIAKTVIKIVSAVFTFSPFIQTGLNRPNATAGPDRIFKFCQGLLLIFSRLKRRLARILKTTGSSLPFC